MIGPSVVHTSRILQQLRGEKLIDLRRSKLTIFDWKRLMAVGAFDPAYLVAA